MKVLSSSTAWTVHLGMVTPKCSLQALGCSCSQGEFPPGQCKGILHLTACSSHSSSCLPWEHLHLLPPRMPGSRAGAPTALPVWAGKAEALNTPPWALWSQQLWAARGDTHHRMGSGVKKCEITVKSVRYWIYMVAAKHIRRSSASSCLFETAIIIQAVTLSHQCFWKTIQY